jgi:hypothetical protein
MLRSDSWGPLAISDPFIREANDIPRMLRYESRSTTYWQTADLGVLVRIEEMTLTLTGELKVATSVPS